MKTGAKNYSGIVTAADGHVLTVRLAPVGDASECVGCAMANACRPASGQGLVVCAYASGRVTEGVSPVGKRVSLEPRRGVVMKAALVLFVIPLVAFIACASLAAAASLPQGFVAGAGLAACLFCYVVIFLVRRRGRVPEWTVTEIHDP